MPTGTVKWFNNQKGYGFISQDGGPDVFAHYTAIAGEGFRTLKEGEEVEFEITEGPKGPQAADIRRKGMASAAVETESDEGMEESTPETDAEPADTLPEEDDTEDDVAEESTPETDAEPADTLPEEDDEADDGEEIPAGEV